jgi:hypothetical protein
MWKAFSAIVASALIAAALTVMPGFVPGLSGDVVASVPDPSAKSDRFDAADCERHGWPYYQRECLKDLRHNAGRASAARLVTTDRVFVAPRAPLPAWAAYLPAMNPAPIDLTPSR